MANAVPAESKEHTVYLADDMSEQELQDTRDERQSVSAQEDANLMFAVGMRLWREFVEGR